MREWLALFSLSLVGCAAVSAAEFPFSDPVEIEAADVDYGLYRTGPVYIGGQPEESALERLAADDIRVVINLRTPGEMEHRVLYDEAELAGELGLDYVSIPVGRHGYGYPPEAIDQLASALERHEGRALIHCGSGERSSQLWVAYLVKYRGMDLDEAYVQGRAMAIDAPPLEALLGRELTLDYAE